MHKRSTAILVGLFVAIPAGLLAGDTSTARLSVVGNPNDLSSHLPKNATLLHDAGAIEKFLAALDGTPPDWSALHGTQGRGHDEDLFALNRERDRLRAGRKTLTQRITFLWEGVLSTYTPDKHGFHVAIGPEVISTGWGHVRFKPENLPAELVATPPANLKESLRSRVKHGETIRVIVAITGRLVPEESLIYDFAHEDPKQGMVMPMVRVERIDYFLNQ